MKRREFITSATIAVTGSLLLHRKLQSGFDKKIDSWTIETEQDNVFATSIENPNYQSLLSNFSEGQKKDLASLLEQAIRRKPGFDEKAQGSVRISLNSLLDKYLPRVRQLLREQPINSIVSPDKDTPWASILNCFGTTLYAQGILPVERGVAAKEMWPDSKISSREFSFNDNYFKRIEKPRFGDLAVITAAPAFSHRKPKHMGIFLLRAGNDAYIFNRVGCRAQVQVNTLSWYCDEKLTHATIGKGGFSSIFPIIKETYYYRRV